MKQLSIVLALGLLFAAANAQTKTDRDRSGLNGPVKSLRVESAEWGQDRQSSAPLRHLDSVALFDERGNLLEESEYQPDGSFRQKRSFAHDNDGHKIVTAYGLDGAMLSKWIYTYNAAGRVTESLYYDATGMLNLRSISIYDGQGLFTGGETYRADGSLASRTVITFDPEKKQNVTTVYNGSGTLLSKRTLAAQGDDVILTASTVLSEEINIKEVRTEAKYEFDAHGNWIKQTWPRLITQADKTERTIKVIYREITYY